MAKLTVLAIPISAVGHVNACTGALHALKDRGHRIIFLLDESFCGKLSPLGYEEYIYKCGDAVSSTVGAQNPGEHLAKLLFDCKIIGDYSPLEKLKNLNDVLHSDDNYRDIAVINAQIKAAIDLYKPDLIYFDGINLHPALYYSGIPFIKNISVVPIYYSFSDEIPPSESGLPSNGSPVDFVKFNKLRHEKFYSQKYNDFIESLGYERYSEDAIFPQAQILTVYAFPEELNYQFVRNQTDWFNLEVFNRGNSTDTVPLESFIPQSFLSDSLNGKFSGKLIYISMGSMGSVDLELMNRLVSVLRETNHKYIVSKGPRHEEFELAPNMYGDRYLPQVDVLKHVDLVIIHGGNNSVTESFAQGKPMIVLPLFADQFDSAQRIEEMGFGVRLNPYKFTGKEMIAAIEKLLGDRELKEKMEKASRRIQAENRHESLADTIEKLCE